MSADAPVLISPSQWRELVTTVSGLGDHQALWLRIITSAAPTFLAFVLGLISAFFLDWQKTRRENRKAIREREEKELSQLNVV
jgi:ABC-type sulfate transport system permease component